MKPNSAKKVHDRYTELFCTPNGITVPVRAETEQSFFDRRDALGVTLSTALREYLDECILHLPSSQKITVVFYCPPLTSTKKEVVRNLVKTHYGLRLAQGEKAFAWALFHAAADVLLAAALGACALFAAHAALRCACAVGAVLAALVAGKVFHNEACRLWKTNLFLRRMYLCTIEFKPSIPEK